MITCDKCGEQGNEERFQLWEDGIPTLVCPKCKSEDVSVTGEDVDALLGWYKGTAVVKLERPSVEEKKNESSNDGK